jgi:hypothetical protein
MSPTTTTLRLLRAKVRDQNLARSSRVMLCTDAGVPLAGRP